MSCLSGQLVLEAFWSRAVTCQMKKQTLVHLRKVVIIVAALLCLFMSIALLLSGLEASSDLEWIGQSWFNVKLQLLFVGAFGALASALSLANEAFPSWSGHHSLSMYGSFFVLFQGLRIVEFGAVTNGWHVVFAFGVPVSALSIVSLIIGFFVARRAVPIAS